MATIYDKVQTLSNTTGTGTVLQITSTVTGYQSFQAAGAANNDYFSYGIVDISNSWEVGSAQYITNSAGQFIIMANSAGIYGGSGARVPKFSSASLNGPITLSGTQIVYPTILDNDYNSFSPTSSVTVANSISINASTVSVGSNVTINTSATISLTATLANLTANTSTLNIQAAAGNVTVNSTTITVYGVGGNIVANSSGYFISNTMSINSTAVLITNTNGVNYGLINSSGFFVV